MTRIVFLDTETTGLSDHHHEVWEIGLIVREPDAADTEYLWHVRPNLSKADPNGLRTGRFYERTDRSTTSLKTEAVNLANGRAPRWSNPWEVARQLSPIVDGATIVGAVPDFDYRFLRKLLGRHGQCWTAHYHLADIEALVAGHLAAVEPHPPMPPWNSNDLSKALGIDPADYDRHTALGDARWVRAQWDLIYPHPAAAEAAA